MYCDAVDMTSIDVNGEVVYSQPFLIDYLEYPHHVNTSYHVKCDEDYLVLANHSMTCEITTPGEDPVWNGTDTLCS